MWIDSQIKAFNPRSKPYRLSEPTRERGRGRLVIHVDPSGTKCFYYKYFYMGQKKLMVIGKYKSSSKNVGFTLSEARERKNEFAELLKLGHDPNQYLKDEKQKIQEEKQAQHLLGSLEDLLNAYIDDMKSRDKRTYDRVEKEIKSYVFIPFSGLKLKRANEITADEIKAILRRMTRKGIKTQTNRVRGHLHAMFQFGLRHDDDYEVDEESKRFNLKFNPVSSTQRKKHFEKVGNHVISKIDICRFWLLSEESMGVVMRAILKFAFASGGQRPIEFVHSSWSCFDLDAKILTIPANISKNGKIHIVPLEDIAISILKDLEPITGHLRYPFSGAHKDAPMRSDSISKATQRFCKKHSNKDNDEKNVKKFIPRDIRRTCKTLMGAAGLSKEIRDRIQNHALHGDVSSIHYDRYDYLAEKRDALRIWNQYLELLIHPKAKVVAIR